MCVTYRTDSGDSDPQQPGVTQTTTDSLECDLNDKLLTVANEQTRKPVKQGQRLRGLGGQDLVVYTKQRRQ
jgi:hypothetical protein